MITSKPLAPTSEAIDAWRALQPRNDDGTIPAGAPSYGVNVWTRRSGCRCVVGAVVHGGERYYRTIRGEGSSNGSRETFVKARDIVRAEGWIVGDDASEGKAP